MNAFACASWASVALAALLMTAAIAPAAAVSSIAGNHWSAFKGKFLEASGRIIDDANGNISHSEGQGYGMLLSVLADSRSDFDRIWSFTRSEMLLRDDGLAVWKWDPATQPHVSDDNNASDGDVLIAYALALAGDQWARPDLTSAARAMARAIWESVVTVDQGRHLLMPASRGFGAGDRDDGPVVNPSYWIFEAFPVLAVLAPEHDWQTLSDDGLALVSLQAGSGKMPPDWLALKAIPHPAKGFPPEFSYNALRIPLYLLRAGNVDRALLRSLRSGMSGPDGSVKLSNVISGASAETLTDPGYRIIPALISCVVDGSPLAADLRDFQPTLYYPSTLHLLSLAFAAQAHKDCLK